MSPASTRVARYPGLEGPRGIAAMGVLAAHVLDRTTPGLLADQPWLGLAGQGVIFFFVLSGFLLYLPFVRHVDAGAPAPDLRTYVRHRVMRIMPAYLLIFLVVNFVLRASFLRNAAAAGDSLGAIGRITDPVLLAANLLLVHTFVPSWLQTGINTSWSLSTEYTFYLVLPLLAWWAARHARHGTARTALLLLGLGVVGKIVLIVLPQPADAALAAFGPYPVAVVSRSLLGLADTFAIGMLVTVACVAAERGRLEGATVDRWRRRLPAAMVAVLVLTLPLAVLQSPFAVTAIALASAVLILHLALPSATGRSTPSIRVLEVPVLRELGRISLSLYLWHYPVIVVLQRLGWFGPDSWGGLGRNLVITSIVSLTLAVLTYRLVERPFMRWATRR